MLLDKNGIGPEEPDPEAEVDAHLEKFDPVSSCAEAMAHLLAGADALGLNVLLSDPEGEEAPTIALFTDPKKLRGLRENITEYLERIGEENDWGLETPDFLS